MQDTPIIRYDGDISKLLKIGKAKPGKGKRPKKAYMDIITAFDIETTVIETGVGYHSVMYIWQWQIGELYTVIGRTWEEFIAFYNRLDEIARSKELIIPVFVFNLSYEFQFLWEILDLSHTAEIFATNLRNVLYFNRGNMEWRCAQRLSNDNLRHWCAEMGVDHQKTELDYTGTRYPWTELTDDELRYCINDVIGLVECVEKQIHIYGDTIYSLPLTSTGYIRRIVKKEMFWIRDTVTKQINDLPIYRMLRNAYRGGNVHGSNTLVGCILSDVVGKDRSSSYPDVMMHCPMPVTKFRPELPSLTEAIRLIKAKRALLVRALLYGVHAKSGNTCPYISYSQCEKAEYIKPLNTKCDNGRIVSADLIEMTITDVDLMIILDTYDIDNLEITEMYSARYGELPYPIKSIIKELYKNKTTLKGVPGKEIEYMKSKNLINAIYGMMSQRAITPDAIIDPEKNEWTYDEYNEAEEYDKYKKKAYLNYAWGVWICAWARLRLQEGIEIAGYYNFVYCDTDSVKSLGDPDFTEYNRKRIADAKKSGAYAVDANGITHYMGVFETEYVAERFVTLGSKRYAYEEGGQLHMTVAGVDKERGTRELEKKGGLEKFRENLTFQDSGHISATYNDHPDLTLNIDGHKLKITSNVALVETPYSLTMEREYHNIMVLAMTAYKRMSQPDLPYMVWNLDEIKDP